MAQPTSGIRVNILRAWLNPACRRAMRPLQETRFMTLAPATGCRPLPLIPPGVLKAHHCHEDHDTRFRANARVLQSVWRAAHSLPIGILHSRQGRKRKLGSLLSPAAADAGRNFLTPAVAHLARRIVAYQEPGGLIAQGRLFGNLLSSAPLTVNCFAPLALDHDLATRLVHHLFPQIDCRAVTDIRFEHSPGRQDPAFTGDRTAFDVVIVYARPDARQGFICIEVKYSESLQEGAPLGDQPRYADLAEASGLYQAPHSALLRVNPLQQLFREHLLAQAAIIRGDWAEATFVLLAPDANHLVQRAASLYASHLTPPLAGQVPFANLTLEAFIAALNQVGEASYAQALHDRYCAWEKIHEVVESALTANRMTWSLASLQPPQRQVTRLRRKAA